MNAASITTQAGSDNREPFAAFVSDEATAEHLNVIASEFGWSPDRVQSGGIANAVRSLSVMTSPDFLIVDFRMPKMNGADFFKNLVELGNPNSKSKILFLSGFIEEIKLQKMEEDFQINFKSKPIAPHELLEFIKNKVSKKAG